MSNNFRFDTLQLHSGQVPDKQTNARAVPIYQTAAYLFNDADHAQSLFALKEAGNIYTRIMNPTTDVLEKRIAALEGGIGALAVASGSAAVTYAILNIAFAGDHIVCANSIYGGTYNLLTHTLPRYGITTTFVNSDDYDQFQSAINEKTKAIFIETIGNPNCNIIDIEKVAEIAHKNKIPLIVDNTFASPYLIQPIKYGADIVVHSATKFIDGHGTTIGGIIVDSGKFDWAASGKFKAFTEPDESYHGISFAQDIGAAAFITKARVSLLRDTGAALSPFNAFLLILGVETLSLRVRQHVENTKKVVSFLEACPHVETVNYAGLENNKYYELAQKYFPKGVGSIFSIDLKGGIEESKKFINNLKLFSLLANVADSKSLVIHPATTTHSQLNEKELLEQDLKPSTIRLSIGIEDIEDIIEDLQNAFNATFK